MLLLKDRRKKDKYFGKAVGYGKVFGWREVSQVGGYGWISLGRYEIWDRTKL
jgi:hypothetical protein